MFYLVTRVTISVPLFSVVTFVTMVTLVTDVTTDYGNHSYFSKSPSDVIVTVVIFATMLAVVAKFINVPWLLCLRERASSLLFCGHILSCQILFT
jgi:hypothetical protein